MKIRTNYDHPPILVRNMDWSAIDEDTYDGSEDSGTRGQIGRGATELEAVADLLERLGWEGPPMPSIQEQIEFALDALKRAFAAKCGARQAHLHFVFKASAYSDKQEIILSIQDGWGEHGSKVHVYGHHLGKTPTIDAAFALAEQRIAALRTLADENADLGLPVRADAEAA